MGFEGYLAMGRVERIGEDEPDAEQIFRDLWEDETQREVVLESLKADCEVRRDRLTEIRGGFLCGGGREHSPAC